MERKFAVFVDRDNISAHDYDAVITEIASYGNIVIKRVYGDWTTPNMNMWKEKIVQNPAILSQEFRAGKNATDTRNMFLTWARWNQNKSGKRSAINL
jgi:hypothetical protein